MQVIPRSKRSQISVNCLDFLRAWVVPHLVTAPEKSRSMILFDEAAGERSTGCVVSRASAHCVYTPHYQSSSADPKHQYLRQARGLSSTYHDHCIWPSPWDQWRGHGQYPAPRIYSRWHRSVHRRSSLWSGWYRPPLPKGQGSEDKDNCTTAEALLNFSISGIINS